MSPRAPAWSSPTGSWSHGWRDELDPDQLRVVLHGDGPLLVLAGAGSGKTRAVTYRMAHLVAERGVAPAKILALTFTNKAAREMTDRVVALVGDRAQEMFTGTFHAFGAKLLRRFASAVGRTRGFTIYDGDDQARVLSEIVKASPGLGVPAQRLRAWIGLVKSIGDQSGVAPPDGLDQDTAGELLAEYESRLRQADAFDFGDLILAPVRILEQDRDLARRLAGSFEQVLVDEYQDTSPAQERLLTLLTGPEGNLVVVGDDDQAIYGWRGATSRNILAFTERRPTARVIKLQRNYRSRPGILEAASRVISRAVQRLGKELLPVRPEGDGPAVVVRGYRSASAEARGIVEIVSGLVADGVPPGEIAVFYRYNALSRQVEDALVRSGIPYKVIGGVRFYERAEIKDLLAYARLLVNPKDEVAARRAMTRPRRGIGPKTMALVAERVAQGSDWLKAARDVAQGKGRAAARLEGFVGLMEDLAARTDGSPPSLALEQIYTITGLEELVRREDPDRASDRHDNVLELLMAASEYERSHPDQSLEGFLEATSLVSDADEPTSRGKVSLMTIHAAKGLEFHSVVVLGMEEGTFPLLHGTSDEEEERRLCYVAFTRAKERLFLTWSRVRGKFGEVYEQDRSRFVDELPPWVPFEEVRGGHARHGWARRADVHGGSAAAMSWPMEHTGGQPATPRVEAHDPGPQDGWDLELPPIGATVEHERFGVGEVVAHHGFGRNVKVGVRFPVRGVKRVLPSHLTPVEQG